MSKVRRAACDGGWETKRKALVETFKSVFGKIMKKNKPSNVYGFISTGSGGLFAVTFGRKVVSEATAEQK